MKLGDMMIYLDYAANTPVDKDVLKTYVDATLKYFGNPNSSHKAGIDAKNKIDEASRVIAKYFDIKEESVIYTSGSSEANNLVIKGVMEANKDKGKHIIISSLEHSTEHYNYTLIHDEVLAERATMESKI